MNDLDKINKMLGEVTEDIHRAATKLKEIYVMENQPEDLRQRVLGLNNCLAVLSDLFVLNNSAILPKLAETLEISKVLLENADKVTSPVDLSTLVVPENETIQ